MFVKSAVIRFTYLSLLNTVLAGIVRGMQIVPSMMNHSLLNTIKSYLM